MDSDDNGETRAQRARRRALRAAQVATISALMMGCNLNHRVDPPTPEVDSGPAPVADAGFDAGSCTTMAEANESEECCNTMGGSWWSESCSWIVEGPGVPPAMSA